MHNTVGGDRADPFGASQRSIAKVVVIIGTAIAVVGAFANVAGFTDAKAILAGVIAGASGAIVARNLAFGRGDTAGCGFAAGECAVAAIVGTSQRIGRAAFAAHAAVFEGTNIAVLAGPPVGSLCLNTSASAGIARRAHARVACGAHRFAAGQSFTLLCRRIADKLTGALVIR